MHYFDLESLELFVRVVDVGSINAAAALAGRSQQAVSERMRRLEEELGVSLLERGARGSRPTEAGKLVADWAADLLSAMETFTLQLASLRADTQSDMWVAASQTIAGYLLPQWLGELRAKHESVAAAPHVHAVNSVEVIREVTEGSVEVGFIETLKLPQDLEMRTVGYDELVVVVAPAHPWAQLPAGITPRQLAETALVLREEGSGTRQALEHLLATFDEELRLVPPAAEFSAVMSVKGAVTAGIAPSVMSTITVAEDLTQGRLVAVSVQGLELRRPLTAIWRPDRALPASVVTLVEIAASGAGKMGPYGYVREPV